MSIVIKHLDNNSLKAWDKYVSSHPQGSFCHRAGWKTVVEQGAGQASPFIYAEQDGDIVGVLPLTVKKHWLFGRALVSSMFAVYGGVLSHDPKVAKALNDAAWDMARKNALPIFESRDAFPGTDADEANWSTVGTSATFISALNDNAEEQLLSIPRKQRAVVRKSLKNNLTTDWTGTVDQFYDLYAQSVHGLGTPVFPKKLFSAFTNVFPEEALVQMTYSPEGDPVASLISFIHRDTIMPYYAGGNQHTRRFAAHDFMYYQLMLEASKRGLKHFDFGRSKADSGPYKFKKNWGFEPTPLHYRVRVKAGHTAPNISQQSGPYAKLSQVWKKLPLGVTKVFGPMLARHLG